MEQLKFKTEERKVKDLVPYKYNPRKLSAEKKQKLKESLTKFDLAEIPVINTDNVIIAGHQRVVVLLELGRGDELIDVRVPNRTLTEEEFKEYNVRSNIQIGEWDEDILKEVFADFDLDDLGFDFEALGEDLEKATELEGNFDDEGIGYQTQYGVIVTCGNEEEQEATYAYLTKKGYNCKVVVT